MIRPAGEVDRLQRVEAGAEPALDLVVGEAEMDMGMLALQLDQVVRQQIDHQHDAARRTTRAASLRAAAGCVGVMQDMIDGHDIEAVALEGQGIHVAQPYVGICRCRRGEVGARQRQHLARLVDADRLLDLAAPAPRAAARCRCRHEQPAGANPKMMGEGALDLAVGDMQCAQPSQRWALSRKKRAAAVSAPLLQASSRRGRRRCGRTWDRGGARTPPDECGIVADVTKRKRVNWASRKRSQQARLDQQLQMARDARLALPQHVHVVADGQIFARRQRQNAQPGIFGRRPQEGREGDP